MNEEKKIMKHLAAPFGLEHLRFRFEIDSPDDTYARALPYLQRRSYIDRLNSVLGADWSSDVVVGDESVTTTITLVIAEKKIVHSDVSELTDEWPIKGAATESFKRACEKVGVGLYLRSAPEMLVPIENDEPVGYPLLPDEFLVLRDRRRDFVVQMRASGKQFYTGDETGQPLRLMCSKSVFYKEGDNNANEVAAQPPKRQRVVESKDLAIKGWKDSLLRDLANGVIDKKGAYHKAQQNSLLSPSERQSLLKEVAKIAG